MDTKAIKRTRRVLVGGRWFLIIGLVFYSAMTTTPFVARHSEWQWSGWVLGLIVDAAFIMALSAESTLAKYGVRGLGRWPAAFRWVTGLSSTFLNVWLSIESHDWVGVAVHLIAPALVMLLAEVGPVYMAALADAEAKALSMPEPEPTKPEPTEPEPEYEPEPVQETLPEPEPEPESTTRLSNKEADEIIEKGWRHRVDPIQVAAAAGRHPATVRRKYKELDAALSV
ncbi:hypothetical protein SEA_EURATIS_50 [Streptomyces phage Euratis]|uniref:Uncharacterized protein n=1 Tax=Streptomyces phage Euratis TaxID=2510569 RepID=A0A411B118_9CAUD|nr:hypothetical protein SEA_EURATIS_50 [Streptomyces phage Euratis]